MNSGKYEKIVKAVHYSKKLDSLGGLKIISLGENVSTEAVLNGMDADYCEALLYARIFEDSVYELITGEPKDERTNRDLAALEQYGDEHEEMLTNEQRCVKYVEDANRLYDMIPNDVKEKIGGSILRAAMIRNHKNEAGVLERSPLIRKVKNCLVSGKWDLEFHLLET